jgi:hypothetical protein
MSNATIGLLVPLTTAGLSLCKSRGRLGSANTISGKVCAG